MIGKKFRFVYENYKGEVSVRDVEVIDVRFGVCPPWHVEPQWLMSAHDIEKNKFREFAMSKMKAVEEIFDKSFNEWKVEAIEELKRGYEARN